MLGSWYQRILLLLDRTKLPGFHGISLYKIFRFLQKEASLESMQLNAAAIAFNSILAMFPTAIVLLSLLPYSPNPEMQGLFFDFLDYVLPHDAHRIVMAAFEDISFASGNIGIFSIGLLFAFYFSSNGIRTLMSAFQKERPEFTERNFIQYQLISLWVTIILIAIVIGTITLVLVGKYLLFLLITYFQIESWFLKALIAIFRALMVFFFVYNSITFIYIIAPALRENVKYINPGAILTSLLVILTTRTFFFFAENFGSYGRLYGSIGGAMVIMVWFYIISLILLIGFELNVSILAEKNEKNHAAHNWPNIR